MRQLKVRRLEELVEDRAVIPNAVSDIHLPVCMAGELPLLQSAPESTAIIINPQWWFCYMKEEEQNAKVMENIVTVISVIVHT